MAMRNHTFMGLTSAGFHQIHYTEWGDPDNDRVLICVHGLTRNARDFDALATALETDYRIVCPDIAGRGQSDWLSNKADYTYPQYLVDMTALIARTKASQIDWVGTSMGGLIGLLLAALPNSPIQKLIINDIGPFIPKAALERIATYVGIPMTFSNLDEMEHYIREIAAPFGPLTDAQWQHLTVHGAKQTDNGFTFAYDPGIAEAFHDSAQADVDLWSFWDQIQCPTLLIRGADSDLLMAADAKAMSERGPRAKVVEFEGIGHAPVLMDAEQIAVVHDWLLNE